MEVAELPAGEPQTQPKLRTEGDKRPLQARHMHVQVTAHPKSIMHHMPLGQLTYAGNCPPQMHHASHVPQTSNIT